MGYFILVGILVMIGVLLAVLVRAGAFDRRALDNVFPGEQATPQAMRLPVMSTILVGLGVALILVTLFASYHQIEAGHVGVVRTFGEITGSISEGPNFIAPWQTVQVENVQTRKAEFRNANTDVKDDERVALGHIEAASFETQDVFYDVVLNYSIDTAHVEDLFRSVGPDWFRILVPNRVQQVFKAEVVRYLAIEATQKREEIRESVTAALRRELDPYGVHIESLQIESISYRPEFSAAIERKQVATQDALREQEIIAQRIAQARQNEETAKGEAAREVAIASGNAQSIVLRADAQAQANRAVAESLTPALVQYTALDKLGGVSIALVPADGTTLIDPTGILRRPAP